MARSDREAAANAAGWVVAAIVAVVAICAVTFMITTQPNPAPVIAAGSDLQPLRGSLGASSLAAEIARSQADQAARLAQQSAASAQTAAAVAADSAAAAANAPSADGAGQNASAVEPVVPGTLGGATASGDQ